MERVRRKKIEVMKKGFKRKKGNKKEKKKETRTYLKKHMSSISKAVSNTRNTSNDLSSWSQMSNSS